MVLSQMPNAYKNIEIGALKYKQEQEKLQIDSARISFHPKKGTIRKRIYKVLYMQLKQRIQINEKPPSELYQNTGNQAKR